MLEVDGDKSRRFEKALTSMVKKGHKVVSRKSFDKAAQTITVVVPGEPGHVGVDPRALLVDVRPRDNFVDVVAQKDP